MRDHLREWAKYLKDEDLSRELIGAVLDLLHEDPQREMNSQERHVIGRSIHRSLSRIHRYAESPIEKVFLGAVLVTLIVKSPRPFAFTGPIRNLPQARVRMAELVQRRRDFVNSYLEGSEPYAAEGSEPKNDYERVEADQDETDEFIHTLRRRRDHGELTHREYEWLADECLEPVLRGKGSLLISPQTVIPDILVRGRGIRCDVLVWSPRMDRFNIVVECDGYATHAEYQNYISDRIRDRQLALRGYTTLRYSGSELHNDAIGCAVDFADQITLAQLRALVFERGLDALEEDG